MGSAYQFHSWRVFVIVCALPCVSSVVALTFMPESPRFLLEVLPVVREAQGARLHWEGFLAVSRKACLPLLGVGYLLPSHHGILQGLVSWRHALGKGVCKSCLTVKATHTLP